jgi:hypothetical protein
MAGAARAVDDAVPPDDAAYWLAALAEDQHAAGDEPGAGASAAAAIARAETIAEPGPRTYNLALVALKLAQAQLPYGWPDGFARALSSAEAMSDPADRSTILGTVALHFERLALARAEAGAFDDATVVAREMAMRFSADVAPIADSLRNIAMALAAQKAVAPAQALAEMIDEPAARFDALGAVERALP